MSGHPYVACPHGGCPLPGNHEATHRAVSEALDAVAELRAARATAPPESFQDRIDRGEAKGWLPLPDRAVNNEDYILGWRDAYARLASPDPVAGLRRWAPDFNGHMLHAEDGRWVEYKDVAALLDSTTNSVVASSELAVPPDPVAGLRCDFDCDACRAEADDAD